VSSIVHGGARRVEALRLGCKVIASTQPRAWFVVNASRPVSAEAEGAFERLAARPVAWAGETAPRNPFDLYRTEAAPGIEGNSSTPSG